MTENIDIMTVEDMTKLFYSTLNTDIEEVIEDEICNISGEKLHELHIKLICGHTFNYEPIFHEVKNQKHNKSYYNTLKLKVNQIQCPYCRNVQDKLLPRINEEKSYGVNYPEPYTMKPHKCKYVFSSGKRKNTSCDKLCFGDYCKTHKRHSKIKKEISNTSETQYCNRVLISGKNKGKNCSCKVYKDGLCKRHYSLK